MAAIFLGLGEDEKALDMLMQGVAEHSEPMVLLGVEPKFDRLRQLEKFKEISRAIDGIH